MRYKTVQNKEEHKMKRTVLANDGAVGLSIAGETKQFKAGNVALRQFTEGGPAGLAYALDLIYEPREYGKLY